MSQTAKAINVRLSVRVSEGVYRQTSSLAEATGVTIFRNGVPKREFDKAITLIREKMARTSRVNTVNDGMSLDTEDQYVQLVRDSRQSLDDILAQDDDGSLPPF